MSEKKRDRERLVRICCSPVGKYNEVMYNSPFTELFYSHHALAFVKNRVHINPALIMTLAVRLFNLEYGVHICTALDKI